MRGGCRDPDHPPRLRLVPATVALLDAELEYYELLGRALGAVIPSDWPPEHHDRETLEFWRERLLTPGAGGWWLHYAVLTAPEPAILIGSVGYKGPPVDGVVEIGYSVVPSWQRRGLATEACRALIQTAWERGASTVVAHTSRGWPPRLECSAGLALNALTRAMRTSSSSDCAARSPVCEGPGPDAPRRPAPRGGDPLSSLWDGDAGRGRARRERHRALLVQLPAVDGELAKRADPALVHVQ